MESTRTCVPRQVGHSSKLILVDSFTIYKNIFSLKLRLGLGLAHINVIVVFCFSCNEGHKEQNKPSMA
jgi:hypothetical protein